MQITGTMYSYSFLCDRKLWLFAHKIAMEQESENVRIGKFIDETTFAREDKNIQIDDTANIDFLRKGIIYEVKKSEKEIQMGINQVKYYLYLLREKGMDGQKGILSIPTKKQTHEIILEEADIVNIKSRLEKIEDIIQKNKPPGVIEKKACKACAYYELCFI